MKNKAALPVLRKRHLRRHARLVPIVQTTLPTKKASLDCLQTSERFKGVTVSSLEISKALDFLNGLEDSKPLAEMRTVGTKVATRIIEHKERLKPHQEFTSLAQLKNIQGFGPTKFRALITQLNA